MNPPNTSHHQFKGDNQDRDCEICGGKPPHELHTEQNTSDMENYKLTTEQLAERLYLLHPKLTGNPFGIRRHLEYKELGDKCIYMSIALFVKTIQADRDRLQALLK